ncbi:hypothetical protein RIF29_20069 [Crotalaria pallida]|uniref:BED-type domain-containing protein n=1 Tax=Crotalaria pallida TaxID=3830 RepID=A0AAN9I608_CROPI
MAARQDNDSNVTPNVNTQTSKTVESNNTTSVRGKNDIASKHVGLKKEGKTNVHTCLHCFLKFRGGGIHRMKLHLAGVTGELVSCKKVPPDVHHQMLQSLKEFEEKKNSDKLKEAYEIDQIDELEDQDVHTGKSKKQHPVQNKGKRKANEDIGSMPHVVDLASRASKIIQEMQVYRDRQGTFGRERAFQVAKTMRPGKNRLEHQRLSDLVYVTYNIRLKNRLQSKKRSYDPIDYESIDNVDFWVVEEEASPEFDVENLGDDVIYQENGTPIFGESSKHNEETDVTNQPSLTSFFDLESGGGASNEDANVLAYDGFNVNEYFDNE